jgi:outer membrane protein TolC
LKTQARNRKLWTALALAGAFSMSTPPSSADAGRPYAFQDIWKNVREGSPDARASGHELEAARINETRMSRHWYPRLFAEGRVYSTNDPAMSFMSLLGQREIGATDFSPDALNHPATRFYEHGAIGLDLPLYEGGARAAAAAGAKRATEAKRFEGKATQLSQYVALASSYGSLLTLERQQAEIRRLLDGVNRTLSSYRVGARTNPVGYSGLLGLKTLRNRLEGMLLENEGRAAATRAAVRSLDGTLPEDWRPASDDPRRFLSERLPSPSGEPGAEPVTVRAMRTSADASEVSDRIERAKTLPKIGLFGIEDLYGGNRSWATGFTAGAYLQWDLFSPTQAGAVAQSGHATAALRARADGLASRAKAEAAGAARSVAALESNLALMEESTKMLEEQAGAARNLFRNGSINALQLVEVLSRRADLSSERANAELKLAEARSTLLINSGTEEAPQ